MTAGRLRHLLLKVDATAEIVVNGEPVTGVRIVKVRVETAEGPVMKPVRLELETKPKGAKDAA